MCPNCFPSSIAGFPSYWEFEAFEAELQQKLMQQQLIPLSLALIQKPAAMAPEQVYQCSSCGEAWALSSPDNAWRGYFLPLAEVAAHQSQSWQCNRERPIGCLALVLTLAGFIIWRLFA